MLVSLSLHKRHMLIYLTTPSLLIKRLSYIVSYMVCSVIYLALVMKVDMVHYFLLHQDIIIPLMKKQYLITNFQSFGLPA